MCAIVIFVSMMFSKQRYAYLDFSWFQNFCVIISASHPEVALAFKIRVVDDPLNSQRQKKNVGHRVGFESHYLLTETILGLVKFKFKGLIKLN